MVIRQYIVQQRTLDNWYDLQPKWDDMEQARDHKEECEFYIKNQDFRIIERTIIERAV